MNGSYTPARNRVALQLMALLGMAASGIDLRLVDAAKQRDWDTVKVRFGTGTSSICSTFP